MSRSQTRVLGTQRVASIDLRGAFWSSRAPCGIFFQDYSAKRGRGLFERMAGRGGCAEITVGGVGAARVPAFDRRPT